MLTGLFQRRAFETAEEGMQYCEEQFLTVAEKYGLCSTEMAAMSLAEVLALHSPVRPHVLCWTK